MKVTQMPPVHAANLVVNNGNTAYGVDVAGGTSTSQSKPTLENAHVQEQQFKQANWLATSTDDTYSYEQWSPS